MSDILLITSQLNELSQFVVYILINVLLRNTKPQISHK